MAYSKQKLLIGMVAALGILVGPAIAQDDDSGGGYSQPTPPPDSSSSGGWFTTPHNEPPPEPPPSSSSGYPPVGQVLRQCESQIQAAMDQCRTMMDEACRILEEQARNCQNGY